MITLMPDNGVEYAGDGYRELSFGDPSNWSPIRNGGQLFISFGDAERGPAMSLSSLSELGKDIYFPAHKHYSDTFRVTLRGSQFVGAESYAAGEFRLHQASKGYGSDGAHAHPDGHWTFVMFGDRRGGRMVPLNPKDEWWSKRGAVPPERVDTDPPGISGLATNFGTPKVNGRLDGSYLERGEWKSDEGRDIGVVFLGDSEVGPINVCIEAQPGQVALEGGANGCDTIFVVVRGSVTCGDRSYDVGTIRLQDGDKEFPTFTAGPDGASLLVICGDRRGVFGRDSDLATMLPDVAVPVTA